MGRKLVCFASIVVLVGLFSPLAMAQQDETYDFDGLEELLGDYNKDASVDGKDFLKWQLGETPFPLSQFDLTEWEDNYGTITSIVDRTDWMTSQNWSDGGFDPSDPNAVHPATPGIPDFGTRVEIEENKYGVNAPVIGPGDTAEAFGVRIGRAGGGNLLGTGLLTMTGGTLTLVDTCNVINFSCDKRIRVGAAQVVDDSERFPGTFNLSGGTVTTDTLWIGSGSHGNMIMSGGVVNVRGATSTNEAGFYFDWTYDPSGSPGPDPQSSELNMTGGTINVLTSILGVPGRLRMHRTSSLNLDGGQILVDGSVELGALLRAANAVNAQGGQQTPNVTVSITDGLIEAKDFLRVGGSVVMTGGILRAASFNEALSLGTMGIGTVEINGGGLVQFEQSNESITDVQTLITNGYFFTTDINGLEVTTVDVSGTDFTQVAVAPPAIMGVPEPSAVVLALLVSVSVICGCRNFCGKKVGTNQFS